MTEWDEDRYSEEYDPVDDRRSNVKKFWIQVVAGVVLASFLGSIFDALRGVEEIGIVTGLLLAAGIIGYIANKQRESENPYETEDPPDIETH